MGWEMVTLRDVARKTKSINPAKFPETVYAHHSIPAFDAGQPSFEAGSEIKSSKIELADGDVLLSKIVPHIARAWAVQAEVNGFKSIGSSEWMVFNDPRFLPDFLTHLFKSQIFRQKFMTTTAGVGGSLTRARPKAVHLIQIPLPPLEEQQRIATILGTVEKAIHFSLEALSARQLLRKSVIEKVLEQNSEAPSLSLSQIAEISSGITKGRKVRPDTPLTDTPYLAVSNVKDGYLDLGTVSTIAITDHEKSRFALHDGDILLTEGGDPDKLGRGVVWRGEIEGAIHQNHIFRCRLNEETNYNPEALMAVISSQGSKQYFLQCAKQTTGIATINKTQLSKLKVPDLDSGVLNRMQEMLHKVDNEILLSHRKIELLRELYASLSSRAFAGEL